ncbi:hypothetical protein [Nocardioides houyundeii]|uniref:hypothetical protein n=1 Tax=Nocardioides houyundeii TaxID=2045452 RepID=UPI0013155551|nr:hypothetical protein [Nocardioides houyundeii]
MTTQQQVRARPAVTATRGRVAQLLWVACALAANLMACGALLVALRASEDHYLVSLVLSGADSADLHIFDRHTGLGQFSGERALIRSTLLNWGLAAVAWLAIGRVLDRLARP